MLISHSSRMAAALSSSTLLASPPGGSVHRTQSSDRLVRQRLQVTVPPCTADSALCALSFLAACRAQGGTRTAKRHAQPDLCNVYNKQLAIAIFILIILFTTCMTNHHNDKHNDKHNNDMNLRECVLNTCHPGPGTNGAGWGASALAPLPRDPADIPARPFFLHRLRT